MQEIINTDEIKSAIDQAVKDIKSSATLREMKMKFLGKTGEIAALMKKIRELPPEERPATGKIINALREWAEQKFDECEAAIKQAELGERYLREKIDVTLPGKSAQRVPSIPIRSLWTSSSLYFRAWALKSTKAAK